jgi:hypothetical protein
VHPEVLLEQSLILDAVSCHVAPFEIHRDSLLRQKPTLELHLSIHFGSSVLLLLQKMTEVQYSRIFFDAMFFRPQEFASAHVPEEDKAAKSAALYLYAYRHSSCENIA